MTQLNTPINCTIYMFDKQLDISQALLLLWAMARIKIIVNQQRFLAHNFTFHFGGFTCKDLTQVRTYYMLLVVL